MKKIVICSLVLLFISCLENKDMPPSETAKIVAESFYHADNATLKEYTTASGYANLSSIQEMFIEDKGSESGFKVWDEQKEGEVTWIKYSTSYDPTMTQNPVFLNWSKRTTNGRLLITNRRIEDRFKNLNESKIIKYSLLLEYISTNILKKES